MSLIITCMVDSIILILQMRATLSGRARIQIQVCLAPKPTLFILYQMETQTQMWS